jgi:hypothetical protein
LITHTHTHTHTHYLVHTHSDYVPAAGGVAERTCGREFMAVVDAG